MRLMTLHINILGIETVTSQKKTAVMIRFDGSCEGPVFRGTILPGGVDTQLVYSPEMAGLSARYMLTGETASGQCARLFIQNDRAPGEEFTHPAILTDCPELAWLEDAALQGSLDTSDGELKIYIDTCEQ